MAKKGLGRLKGKVAIVTGGGVGIGGGISRVFAREGAQVVVAEIDPKLGAEAVGQIEAEGGKALFVKTDVKNEADIIAMIEQAVSAFGGLDILVNNVGFGSSKDTDESTLEDWHHMMDTNVRSTFLATKYATPALRARGGGSIINIGSLFGVRAIPQFAIYHTTKGAVRQYTKTTAMALAKDKIRVNIVHPGIIATPSSLANVDAQKIASASLGPLGVWGEPEDIAFACVYLASDEAKYVTGTDLMVDGGLSI